MALTLSWTLPNKLPPMVDRGGLVLGRGVRAMNCDLNKKWCSRCSVESICCEEKLCDICRESESVLCGDCLRSDCIHLEEARA